jgi:hypothetical protein
MQMNTSINLVLGIILVTAVACSGGDGGSGEGGSDDLPDAGDHPDTVQTPDTPPPGANPCRRVDLVISMDASNSMRAEIEAMSKDVFPLMAEALLNIGQGLDDYRIGVLDACPSPANFHTRGKARECEFQSGEVWMDSHSTALTDEFSCVADMYTADIATYPDGCSGDNDDDERPAWTAYAALTPPFINEQNAGFLRDDALLVIMAITDEDEETFGGQVSDQEIYDNLISIKGNVDKMVFLGVGGATACDANQGAYGSALEAVTLKRVTERFIAQERGVFWDLCSGRLEDGLAEAMQVIEATCNIIK